MKETPTITELSTVEDRTYDAAKTLEDSDLNGGIVTASGGEVVGKLQFRMFKCSNIH